MVEYFHTIYKPKSMNNTKIVATLVFCFMQTSLHCFAQKEFNLGGSFNSNYLNNNFAFSYERKVKSNYFFEVGIKSMINRKYTNDPYIYVKNGHFYKPVNKIGLQFQAKRRIWKGLYFHQSNDFSNVAIRNASLVTNSSSSVVARYFYFKPALSYESTIGLELRSNLTKRIVITNAVGFGFLFSKIKLEQGYWEDTGEEFSFAANNWEFFDDVIGLEGFPTYKVALKYSFLRRKK